MGDYDVVKAVLGRIAEMRWMQIAIKPGQAVRLRRARQRQMVAPCRCSACPATRSARW
jgi:molybdopterin biosynthesis enzyme